MEIWPPTWARATAFFVGLGIIVYESTVGHSLGAAGFGLILTGLPIARGLDKLVDAVLARGK